MLDNTKLSDKKDIANKFNEYFINIGPDLAEKIEVNNAKQFEEYLTEPIFSRLQFTNVNDAEIQNIIQNLPSKTSCGFDNLSLKIIKTIKGDLLSPLTIIINQMLNTGIFPEKLKIAKIKPIFKKGENTCFTNYRPISLLPAISKIFERVIYNQLTEYFQNNKLFFSSQYGFRKEHSTELACIEIVDRIIMSLDENETPINIYLDLSKAFDTLDHNILLSKLRYYGIKYTEYNLFKSYLSNRKQYVEFEGELSQLKEIKTGVPQGSILGPLLFIIYMNDIPKCSKLFKFITYADDTSLASVISTFGKNLNPNTTCQNINTELNKISDWLKVNRLSLNVGKTKYMLFHSIKKKINFPEQGIHINGKAIERVQTFNFLGLYLDSQMTWQAHINALAGKINRSLGILNRLKHYLPLNIKKLMYNSLVLSYLNYGILLWGFTGERIFKLQKKILRVISLNKYNAHTDPIFKNLNILKLNDIFVLNQLKFYHKLVNNKVPEYLNSLQLIENNTIHQHNTQIARNIHTIRVKHSFAKKCLRYNLPILINNTPKNIKDKVYTHSLPGFSTYIKKIYIEKYENSCQIRDCYVCNNN